VPNIDAVKIVVILALVLVIGLLFLVVANEFSGVAEMTEMAWNTYAGGDYPNSGGTTQVELATALEVGRSLLIEPLFGVFWTLLAETISQALVAFILAFVLVKLVGMVLS